MQNKKIIKNKKQRVCSLIWYIEGSFTHKRKLLVKIVSNSGTGSKKKKKPWCEINNTNESVLVIIKHEKLGWSFWSVNK